ncbi:MAG: hypothetical protein MRY63_03680 [Neomegalonema sp.]|nr:hypothetical protein [Neomegalonema sp.]
MTIAENSQSAQADKSGRDPVGGDTVSAVREALEKELREKGEDLGQDAQKLLREVEALVRAHPLAAAGGAFLIGWLVGSMFRR